MAQEDQEKKKQKGQCPRCWEELVEAKITLEMPNLPPSQFIIPVCVKCSNPAEIVEIMKFAWAGILKKTMEGAVVKAAGQMKAISPEVDPDKSDTAY